MSIYAASNGVAFLPASIPADHEFGQVLAALREALDLTELHLTGGEPTLHPDVARLTRSPWRRGSPSR
jgi:molybdenum cofactor biosynthesis enzyme MoaA